MTDNLNEETLSTERPYNGKILNLRIDTIKLPSGRRATREVIEDIDVSELTKLSDIPWYCKGYSYEFESSTISSF